jgi:hypothetical protein
VKKDFEAWAKRAEEILAGGTGGTAREASEAYQFATSMLTTLYGAESPQVQALRANAEALISRKEGSPRYMLMYQFALGVIENTKREADAGLIVNLRVLVAGELLAELLRLAKDVLGERTEEATNVAAVLIASAFETLIRKMGEEFAGITDRPKLEEVVSALKTADVLRGGQIGTALSYLKFRNDALHADWKKVDRSQVQSCLAFVEELLTKHFA